MMGFVNKHIAAGLIGLSVLATYPTNAPQASSLFAADFELAVSESSEVTRGWSFSTGGDSLQVTHLGTWATTFSDPTWGLSGDIQIGLWNADGTSLLASATFAAGDGTAGATGTPLTAPSLGSQWFFVELSSSVVLDPNTTYVVGSFGTTEYASNPMGSEFAPGINFIANAFSDGTAFEFPASTEPFSSDAFFGANFLFTVLQDPPPPPPQVVPEPGTLALIGTGLVGLGLLRRRRRRTA